MALIRTSPRMQSKNKGICLEKSSSVEEIYKQLNHKLIANEIKKGNRPFLVLSQAGGLSGIGFDSETGMFQASDEWWDKMESRHQLLVSTIGPRERKLLKWPTSHPILWIVSEHSHLLIRYLHEQRTSI
ncbi:hypothetical protein CsSME_00019691 [Camellia sinensis var. sinensis]